MMAKSIVLLFLVPLILISIMPYQDGAENEPWWNRSWAYRQEIIVPIDTTVALARFQPVDTTIVFEHPCWAPDEQQSSVRVIMQTNDLQLELESQIYGLNHTDASYISSCNLVFLIPENTTGDEQYYVYYSGSKTTVLQYPDHVSIEDSSYSYEPLPGYPFQSHFYKISQDGKVVYAVSQEGEFLWYSTSQYVTKLVDGATEMIPKNGEAAASFDFAYYYGEGLSAYNSTSQKLVSKEILTDGNLMVSCRIISRSNGDDLETTAVYTYYYCPTLQKRIQVHVTHTALRDCKIYSATDTDGSYASLQCGRIRSTSIQDLNFGMLYPYLHVYTDHNTTEEYPVDLNIQYNQNEPVLRLIGTNDDVDLGAKAWADFDEGANGTVHALLFSSNAVVKAGPGELDGIQLKMYESAYPHLPGLTNDVAGFECTRNAYEPGDGPRDYTIPKGFMASFEAEFFSAPTGGSSLVSQEADLFQSLARIKPSSETNTSPKQNETKRYNLTVVIHHAPAFSLGADLAVLTEHHFPYITIELYKNDQVMSSGTAVHLPSKPVTNSSATFFGKLIAVARTLDVRHLSIFKRAMFQSLEPGHYLVKVFKENPFFRITRQFIGYATVDLTYNKTINIYCTHEGSEQVILKDQHGNGIQGATVSFNDGSTVIVGNLTDQQGTALLTAPCGITKVYTMQILYNGFLVDNEYVPFHAIRAIVPLKRSLQLDQYDWTFTLIDTWGLPPGVEITPRLSSNDMKQPTPLNASEQEPGVFTYTQLLHAKYRLQMQYKSFSIEQNITIPAPETSVVFPATFPVTFHVVDTHGLTLTDAIITINRSGKTAKLTVQSPSTLTSLPPGDYTIAVFFHNNVIGRRPLTVSGERTVNLVTTQDPLFPALIIVIIIISGMILTTYSAMKKDLVMFFLVLAVCLVVIACVLPWWSLRGNSADVTTSSIFYLAPPQFVTMTKTASVLSGELSYAPELFTTIMSMIPVIIASSCILCVATIVFQQINKKRAHFVFLVGAILLFGGCLAAFSFAMMTYSQAGVGSFLGAGIVEVPVPGISNPLPIQCHWGPAEGFIVFIGAFIVLLVALLLSVIQKKK